MRLITSCDLLSLYKGNTQITRVQFFLPGLTIPSEDPKKAEGFFLHKNKK
jgi:hypothetical protein